MKTTTNVTNSKRKMIARAKKVLAGKALITFRKKDGSVRVMLGTNNLKLIPKVNHPKGGKSPNGVIVAYDLKKLAWRSFIPQTVISVLNVKEENVEL